MEGPRAISPQEFLKRMRAKAEQALREVAQAVNDAPDGRVIAASEYPVRDVMDRLKREAYEEALQMRGDAADAAFSPSA